MPYNRKQCSIFAMMASGHKKGTPPKDWRKYCKKSRQKKSKK